MKGISKVYEEHHKKNRNIEATSFGGIKSRLYKKYAGKNNIVLDVGCRGGVMKKIIDPSNTIYGFDIDKRALASAKKKGLVAKFLDINEYDEPLHTFFGLKEKFDVIIIGDVLEHIYFPEKKLAQLKASLKPGGVLIGNVPNAFFFMHRLRYLFGNIKGTPLEDPTHINQFSFKRLNAILKRVFTKATYEPIIDKKYVFLTPFSKSLFYYGIFFRVVNRSR